VSITEAERHQLYQRLEQVLGSEEANVLMEHLPPVGWADVATKRDLEHLELSLRNEIASLEVRLLREQRTQFVAFVTANTAFMSAALVLLRLTL
jgi:hypothetical protein